MYHICKGKCFVLNRHLNKGGKNSMITWVEANDAIAVAGMTRPKQQPNELLSDLAISASTKLQAFRNIGKYMKQTSKALEEQVAREARFYGALMRLQRNWKVKRQRLISAGPGGSAGFTIDLSDHIAIDPLQTSFSAVHVDQDNSGMLAVNRTEGSNHVLHVGFQGGEFGHKLWESIKMKLSSNFAAADEQQGQNQELEKGQGKGIGERVDEGAKQAHSILRETQCAVSDEKVFNLVAQAAFDSSSAISVTGIRENFLKLRLSPEMFLTIALLPAVDNEREIKDDHHSEEKHRGMINGDFFKSFGSSNRLPNPLSSEVYLQQIFHQHAVAKMHGCRSIRLSSHTPIKSEGGLIESQMSDTVMWLKHFCMTLSHRIYCYKVISEMEKLVRVPYLHLFTHPTWHCCMSEWYLYLKVPEIVTQGGHVKTSEGILRKKRIRSQFHCKIVVHGEQLTIEAEGTPNIGCLFKGSPAAVCLKSEYSCGLSDLASMLLQQVASQLIYWLHEEALVVGMKVTRDYLSLSFQLDDGDSLSLVAGIDLHGYCVIWWLIMNDTKVDNGLGKYDPDGNNMDKKRYLGPLQLETLYAVLMDLVTLCGKNGEF
eukprot:TRINITY_DN8013_c0_g1_i2.p1 TRINITY_DN8013_c0_g1~~TRINITY_DN8013_c0_g1_i2.p1  ORF type:complete len:598 (+),score=133.95 TRINITY_DN8013_c0_g1_i2:40-1833(+)